MSKLVKEAALNVAGSNPLRVRLTLPGLDKEISVAHIKYTKELLEEAVKDSKNFADVIRWFGTLPVGGNFRTIQRHISNFGIDISHFEKVSANKGKPKGYLLEDILEGKHPTYKSSKLKPRLISARILEEVCTSCGNTSWLGGKIPLELDHIDGDCSNNTLCNLRLLCPNCHALTDTYRGRNKGRV